MTTVVSIPVAAMSSSLSSSVVMGSGRGRLEHFHRVAMNVHASAWSLSCLACATAVRGWRDGQVNTVEGAERDGARGGQAGRTRVPERSACRMRTGLTLLPPAISSPTPIMGPAVS